MKKLSLFCILAVPLFTAAQFGTDQTTRKRPPRDSVEFYQKQLAELTRINFDSLKQSSAYTVIEEKIKLSRSKSANYSGPVLFGDVMHSDYAKFNKNITKNGFSAMNAVSLRLGLGISSQFNRKMLDFYAAVASFNQKSTKGDEKIKSGLSNLFQFDFGYDFVKSRIISLYPYVGVSIRSSLLNYTKSAQTNSSYTDITNIVVNDQSVMATSIKIGYQAGVGFDVLISKNTNKVAGTYLFTKVGTNSSFGKDKYKIHDIRYNPEIKQGDWLVSVGFKFVSWN